VTDRVVKVSDLVGVAEIAQRLGVTVHAVHKWRTRDLGFPEPVARLQQAMVWAWPDVAQWAIASGRLP
jgi:hypothetical protein